MKRKIIPYLIFKKKCQPTPAFFKANILNIESSIYINKKKSRGKYFRLFLWIGKSRKKKLGWYFTSQKRSVKS